MDKVMEWKYGYITLLGLFWCYNICNGLLHEG